MITFRQTIVGFVCFFLVAGLPLAGHFARRRGEGCCALDGVKIVPIYRVRIVDQQNQSHEFCCICCAQLWLGSQPPKSRTIYVTDEGSGQELEAQRAYFVNSPVVTTPTSGNRIHVFGTKADANRHADLFVGVVLPASENPFLAATLDAVPGRNPQKIHGKE